MGIHKHGKTSAKSKSNERYKAQGRYQVNKARRAENRRKWLEKIAAQKTKRRSHVK